MTKAELIKMLEPFDDDIPIVIAYRECDGQEPIFLPAEAKYCIANVYTKSSRIHLTKGDGYIEIA